MDKTTSDQPIAASAASSDAPPELLILQRIEDLVQQSATDFCDIKPPPIRQEDKIVEKRALINHLFEQCGKQQSGDDKRIQEEIIQYAGELKMIEVSGIGDAEKAYKEEISSLLQRLSDQLVETMGPAILKRSLQKVAAGHLAWYFPDVLLSINNEETAARPESVQLRTGNHQTHEMQPRMEVSEPGDNIELGTMREIQQIPTQKHPRDDMDEEQERPTKKNAERRHECRRLECRQDGSAAAITTSTASETAASPFASHSKVYDQNATENTVTIEIVDADNRRLGVVKHAGRLDNDRADALLQRPVKRPVRIRRGRSFSQAQLDDISDRSERSDKKAVKRIISLMIQATGQVMDKRCAWCEKKHGAFEDCTKLDDERFPRCGNCEWDQQGCEGAKRTSSNLKRQMRRRRRTNRSLSVSAAVTKQNGPSPATTGPSNETRRLLRSRDDISVPTQSNESLQASSVAGAPAFSLPNGDLTAHHTPRETAESDVRIRDYCSTEELSEADSCESIVVTQPYWRAQNYWRIRQATTQHFTSSESARQYWCWVKEEGCLKYMVVRNAPPVQWEVLPETSSFDVELKEVVEVRASVQSWRVQLIMRENSSISGRGEAPRPDIMVVLKHGSTVERFLRFCRKQNITVVELEPSGMVDVWRRMTSDTLMADVE